MTTRSVRLVLLLAGAALCLAGCGRRSDVRQEQGAFYPHHYPDVMFPNPANAVVVQRMPAGVALPSQTPGGTTFQDLKTPQDESSGTQNSSDPKNSADQKDSSTPTTTGTNAQ